MTDEIWRPIPGWEDRYQVSNFGRVRSRRRRGAPGGLRRLANDAFGYRVLSLSRPGARVTKRVHVLVLTAFVGPRPTGHLVRHLDGDPSNNRLSNLAWGTSSENNHDQVRHGTHPHAAKDACPRGHPYSPENTYLHPNGERRCRICGGYRTACTKYEPKED